jgi:hypothetical protein
VHDITEFDAAADPPRDGSAAARCPRESARCVGDRPAAPTFRADSTRGNTWGDRRCVLICTTAGMKEHKWDGWGTVAVTGGAFVTDTAGQRTGRSARPAP